MVEECKAEIARRSSLRSPFRRRNLGAAWSGTARLPLLEQEQGWGGEVWSQSCEALLVSCYCSPFGESQTRHSPWISFISEAEFSNIYGTGCQRITKHCIWALIQKQTGIILIKSRADSVMEQPILTAVGVGFMQPSQKTQCASFRKEVFFPVKAVLFEGVVLQICFTLFS